jgi:hypothetical protein
MDRTPTPKVKDFGPILCVCYTNHALDQFLEALLDRGITKIVRVGSRSNSERLQGLSLTEVAKKDKPRSCASAEHNAYTKAEEA